METQGFKFEMLLQGEFQLIVPAIDCKYREEDNEIDSNCKDWLHFEPNELELNFERCLKVGSWVNEMSFFMVINYKKNTHLLIELTASITFECNIQRRLE